VGRHTSHISSLGKYVLCGLTHKTQIVYFMTLCSGTGPATASAHTEGFTSHLFRYPVKHRVKRVPGFLSSPNWVPQVPHPQASVAPRPPLGSRGETHLLTKEGMGDPIPTKEQTLWYSMYTIIPPRNKVKFSKVALCSVLYL
jgi:hypothetical protein